ncbi:MAG: hypothetical protein BGO86_00830 [Chryseobacterium sp. 36-9]|uniref:Uncharacterized protein n=1 Tax=Epilithonimonas pallida TaxID=373671 RepID=A0ABY1QYT0_9FLAO|nr:hypothetical protein [Epilithonimonas pallida]OJX30971.1 MAG: hypothetical protein BGO86_00830 [Chryseobacterium sp. 36-9]SMP88845.1 hypothetical protein SAMN05421679_101563 [Epilithonimonas pallida]
MRTKITFLWFFCNLIFFNAQQNSNFEKLVNEEFGTLLESLLVDGKLDNDNAKAYLATVYGYNTDVNDYLQNADFSTNLNSINSTNLNTLQYVELVNSSLLNAIPNQKFQQISQNISDGLMFYNGIYDVTQGNITSNAIGMGIKIFDFFTMLHEGNKQWKLINQKIKNITPTLTKLNASTLPYTKLKIIDDFSSGRNWAITTNPPLSNYSTYIITTNLTEIKDNYLTISTKNYNSGDWFNLGISKEVIYKKARFYKNLEKFDFSKDFKMTLDVKLNINVLKNDRFLIHIGKGVQFEIWKHPSNTITFVTPIGYDITNEFGVLSTTAEGTTLEKKDKIWDKNKGIYLLSRSYGEQLSFDARKYLDKNFNEVVQIQIEKKGNIFTCRLNDKDFSEYFVTARNVNYFPDKYYLGFEILATNQKASVEIHRLELEHL